MTPDTMQVRLHLRLIRVLAVVVDALDELVVAVCSTRSWSRCPYCGLRCRSVHDTRLRRIRDLPVSGRPVTLEWHRRRFAGEGCGERHLEAHDEFEGRLTRRLARAVVADAKVMSVRAVARRHRLSWAVVMELVRDGPTWSAPTAGRSAAGCCWWTRPPCAGATATSRYCKRRNRRGAGHGRPPQ